MHPHVRALITRGRLDAEGGWRIPVRGPRFLSSLPSASKVFRRNFLTLLDAAHRSSELPTPLLRSGSGAPLGARQPTWRELHGALSADEFNACSLCHVLPTGFNGLRHYGILACGHKRARLPARLPVVKIVRPRQHDPPVPCCWDGPP